MWRHGSRAGRDRLEWRRPVVPNHIKLILSILVAFVAVGVHVFQARADQDLNSWLALGLGLFMIIAMWLFPEAKGKKQKSEGRR
jgi:hypothetical protein